ncbi:FecR family protein [Robertkochia solimangrovi]|uniref:FecR family protein n=1 Tax=Robertkochia solimangrovi TaxID=2213046 RepID=UPI00117CC36B|nr:FecR domain-containing protein [Robertkochia solimangrovi]TRZ45716.1 hypothetical protein DMZ48_00085 [Robertkochia solimangrovi]
MNFDVFYELAAKVLTGEATPEELKELEGFLSDPEYRHTFEWLKTEWRRDIRTGSEDFDLERGLGKLRLKIQKARAEEVSLNRSFKRTTFFRVAATLTLLIGTALGYYLLQYGMENPMEYIVVSSAPGERNQVVLSDGSTVYLNSGAMLKYPKQFNGSKRIVELTGEAFFQVERNIHKPFIVSSGKFKTTVLGTSFDVLTKDSTGIAVTVESGKVKVCSEDSKAMVILEKGDRAAYDCETQEFEASDVDARLFTDWHRNILRFEEITTAEAFNTLENWYGITIHCDSEDILNRKIRAVYTDEPLETVLDNLRFMIGFEVHIENDSIIIK